MQVPEKVEDLCEDSFRNVETPKIIVRSSKGPTNIKVAIGQSLLNKI
jgi:precorrin isomerase